MTTSLSKLDNYFDKGFHQKDWYVNEVNNLIYLLPEFKDLPIVRVFAVTSMSSSIESNVHLAIKALLQWKRNEPFTGFLPNQILYLNLLRQGKDVPGRKIMSFIRALEGDEEAVVVDIWMCRAFNIIRERPLRGRSYFRSPSKKEYDCIESFVKIDAKRRGVTPRQYQAIIWTGIKTEQGFLSKNVCWSDLLITKKGLFSF